MNTFLSPAVRRRKKASGLTFNVRSMKLELTSPCQKCDGKRPCTTCVIGKDGVRCTYEPRQRSPRISTNAHSASRENTSGPQSVLKLPSNMSADWFSTFEPLARPSSDVPLLTWSGPDEPASSLPPPPPLIPYERPLSPSSRIPVLGSSSDIPVVRDTHGTAGCVPCHTVSSFTLLPSLHFQTIPRPLRVPLSLISPEHAQISPIAGGDLDMTLYVLPQPLHSHRVVGTKL